MSRYTVEITIHRAQHVPVGDILHLSSDPYIWVALHAQNSTKPPEEQILEYRTHTVRENLEPVFDCKWIVGGVPDSGFALKLRLRDEDPGQFFRDDRLGKGLLLVPGPGGKLEEGWELGEKECKIEKRKGGIQSHISTYIAGLISTGDVGHHTRVWVSVRVLGKSSILDDGPNRIYTLGPHTYARHFSPLIGRAVHTNSNDVPPSQRRKKELTTTSFVGNRLQLTGPVPTSLRHRYVGYRPFIELMFSKSGVEGRLLHRALHRQYATIYGYGKNTEWGVVDPSNDNEDTGRLFAEEFLRMTSFGAQGRIFTYVITLDGEMRFTETGEEFAIELLSKHSMHADVAKEIAFSGEFFVRLMEEHEGESRERNESDLGDEPGDEDPKRYELVIDNSSGTYRPRKELLPILAGFLSSEDNFRGLGRVLAMDCFDEVLKEWKEERKETKRRARGEGKKERPSRMVQVRSNSSTSSVLSNIEGKSGRWCS